VANVWKVDFVDKVLREIFYKTSRFFGATGCSFIFLPFTINRPFANHDMYISRIKVASPPSISIFNNIVFVVVDKLLLQQF